MEKHKLLFVDDEQKILNSMQRLLRKEGYKIFLADSAKKGLKILEQETIELVISDQNMPEMDGLAFLHMVKEKWPNVIRIMLTGLGFTETAKVAISKCDVYRFITKPWNDDEIKEAIRQTFIIYGLKGDNHVHDKKSGPSYTFQKIENLKDLLISEKLLTNEQIAKALEIRKYSKESLAGLLVKLNYITEKKLLDFLSRQLKIPFAKLSDYTIDPSVIQLIPEKMARRYKTIAIAKEGNKILLGMADPADLITMGDIQALIGKQGEIKPFLCSELELFQAMEIYYSQSSFKEEDTLTGDKSFDTNNCIEEDDFSAESEDSLDEDEDLSVISLINDIISTGVKRQASDIHLDKDRDKVRIRYRVDGMLFKYPPPAKDLYLPIVSRIKIMAALDISQKWVPQDGRIRIKVSGKDIELRVSTYPTIHGESIVMRILDRSTGLLEIPALGLSERDLESFQSIITRSYGMFLVTGPTGSGKTTTLYSILKSFDANDRNIITIEEPVEYELNNISQGEIKPKRGLAFANALRAILRHDPDIILVGEIRDQETAQIAFRAAMTGHLVFSTLHTNSAVGTLSRLVDLGVEPFIIGSSLKGVLSQRLLRKICPDCKETFIPDKELLEKIRVPKFIEGAKLTRGKGCNKCKETGYKGRVGLFEMLPVNKKIGAMIARCEPESNIEDMAIEEGMSSLRTDGFNKVLQGITTLEEVVRVT